jgi:hypothetical protein
MTDHEWQTSTDPGDLLAFLHPRASDRKRRLFACACCRRIWHLLTDPRSRQAVEVAEQYADGQVGDAKREEVRAAAMVVCDEQAVNRAYREYSAGRSPFAAFAGVQARLRDAAWVAWSTTTPTMQSRAALIMEATRDASAAASNAEKGFASADQAAADDADAAREAERAAQVALLRCLFGNPFQPVQIDPVWLASNDTLAVKLARAIDEERAWERLPILADALEDAGCTSVAILAHCRGPGPHARGCWVVDLILARE